MSRAFRGASRAIAGALPAPELRRNARGRGFAAFLSGTRAVSFINTLPVSRSSAARVSRDRGHLPNDGYLPADR